MTTGRPGISTGPDAMDRGGGAVIRQYLPGEIPSDPRLRMTRGGRRQMARIYAARNRWRHPQAQHLRQLGQALVPQMRLDAVEGLLLHLGRAPQE